MGVNKVIYGDTPIVDLTDSTVTPQNLLSGEVAYSASGNRVVGEVVTTTVVPNPTGTPTDELLAIQIGNDIYSLPEGESEHLLNDILTGPDATKATASSTSQDGAIWKAFDGVKTGTEQSCWIPEYGSTNCWICYHFATPKYITKCHVYFYENMSGTYTGAVKIQGSNDGETWTDISQSQALSMTRGVHDYEIESTDIVNGYSYVRMFSETALVVYGSASACTLELEIYGRDNASGTTVIPNPEGTATDTLNKIQIGNDIYEIPTGSDEGGYLTADGNCYSTLPVYSDENDVLKIQFKFWSSDASADNQTIIGSSFAGNSDYLLYMTVENGEPIYSYAIANNYTYIKAPRSTEDYDDIELGYDYMIVNGTTYTSQAPAKHSVHRPICVFGSNYRGSGTIGEIKIYKSDVLTYDLVPSLWTGNVGRFIDVLNNDTPYPSEGTSDYGYIGTSSGTTVIANPEGEATDTLTKIQIGDDIYEIAGGSGGSHTILDDSGIPLAQENNLQFKGTYSHDDSTNGKTIVEVTRSMTRADFDQLTPAEKKGVISIIDENGLPWKDITGVLPAGETEITLGDIAINSNSTFDIYTSPIEVSHDSAELIEGTETVLQPLITQESELLGTITVASTLSGYDGWKAFTSTSAWVGAGNIDQWFAYEFPTDVVVSKIQWNCDDGSRRGTATSIQYSSNGTTWNDCTLSKNERGDVEISSINSAKHWRLFFAAPFSSWTEPMINNLEFISTVNGVKITFPAQAENLNVKVRIS